MGHREQLLEAAQRLLEERGYAHITARDLVAASNTNLASIGYHFGSKAALLNAAIEASFEHWAEQLASMVMADPEATAIQRGMATWVSVRNSLPDRRPMLQSYVEALAQAQREPALRAQLAEHYRRARARVAELVALSLRDGTPADDPRCAAIAAFVIAVCDGLSVQWLLDPEGAPDGDQLLAGLATVWANSFPDSSAPKAPNPSGATGRR
ncbi:MAG TPA: TetR/AcrR family transcriptional regulator [Jatrophihabitantaceae bacterium]|nr:TetR/AcrR family transcriptional regulator [Jatrophihabitantaceae bacterium]